MELKIIGNLEVGKLSDSSGVFVGTNRQSAWRHIDVQYNGANMSSGEGNMMRGLRSLLLTGSGTKRRED